MTWTEPKDWTAGEVVTAQDLDTHLKDNMNAVLPLGTYILVVREYTTVETTLEGRWLQCNGVAVSRTTYSVLFNLLNTFSTPLPFGAGDGTTTFNIPDLRGRVPYAEGEHSSVDVLGDNEGVVLSRRGPVHYHQYLHAFNQGDSQGGAGGVLPYNREAIAATSEAISGAVDKPSYLTAGSWFIKYRA